jgi:2-dehydro-3-deoxygluconokinase
LKLWPSDRAKAIIHQTVSMADIVLPSLEDATALTGMHNSKEIAHFYLSLGSKVVVLKLGGNGAFLASEEVIEGVSQLKTQTYAPYRVNSVDMAGAGDTFDGAFVVGYLSGWSMDRCMRFANAAAALTTTGFGAVGPIPSLKEVMSLMKQQEK